jgi:hypothetical protein
MQLCKARKTECQFCYYNLMFLCFARFILSVIQVAWGLYQPTSIANVFGNWLHGIDYKYKIFLRMGATALIWSLCLCRDDKFFDNKNSSLL